MGGGRLMLPVSAEHRGGAGVAAGDEVEVKTELDAESREATAAARRNFSQPVSIRRLAVRRIIRGWLETTADDQTQEHTMRFMILLKSNDEIEASVMPDEKLLAEMGAFNEELVNAGIMLSGEGLRPSSKGARVRFSGGKPSVVDGPFAESKDLIAGFWMWECGSMEEAIEWVKRVPSPMPGSGPSEAEIEIRQLVEADDFGEAFTPQMREQEELLRSKLASKE